MVRVMHLYADDSGTRNIDHRPGKLPSHGRDWFAMGGVVIKEEGEAKVRRAHEDFCRRWNFDPKEKPLHSSDIRSKTGDFSWLAGLSGEDHASFMDDLTALLINENLLGFACVIDRPGYDARYRAKYGRERWSMCRTAFSVLVERSAKHAIANGCKLKVFVERSDKVVDGWVRGYYDHLRSSGMPFNSSNMDRYSPLTAEGLHKTLYDFKIKRKSSPLMQIADLYLWPMAMGGYDPENRAYQALKASGRLIDCHITATDLPTLGIKYSCWEGVQERIKGPDSAGP